jgi:hypothetical protein
MLAKPIIPHWVYRLMGNFGMRQGAKGHGAAKMLKRRPYLASAR